MFVSKRFLIRVKLMYICLDIRLGGQKIEIEFGGQKLALFMLGKLKGILN